jgi:hypothetical protein
MNSEQARAIEDDVADLGAASEVTRGVWDPMLKENFVMPQARDA